MTKQTPRKNQRPPFYCEQDVFKHGRVSVYRQPLKKPFNRENVVRSFMICRQPSDIESAVARAKKEVSSHVMAYGGVYWDPEFGYITADPKICGTGLSIVGIFHLQGLYMLGESDLVLEGLKAMRMRVTTFDDDRISESGHFYIVSNNAMLGISESDLIQRVRHIFLELMYQEIAARKHIVNVTPLLLADSVDRALAFLQRARLLSYIEYLDLLAPLQMASSMGLIAGITKEQLARQMFSCIDKLDALAPQSYEEEISMQQRENRLAKSVNNLFKNVRFTEEAESILSL